MRPSATVIVPFLGTSGQLDALIGVLERVEVGEGDEILVADNRHGAGAQRRGRVRVVPAPGRASSYFARNRAAAAASGEWLVFVDADTVPEARLPDAYLDPEPAEKVGILAGAVVDVAEDAASPAAPIAGPRPSLAARYVVAREKMSQELALERPRPYGQTANCAVRRAAFEQAGGFADDVRSGGDADLCWRLLDAGWRLEERREARVTHRARETLSALLGQLARHGSGMAWLDERHPGAFPPPSTRDLAGRVPWAARRAAAALGEGDTDEAAFAALDALALYARDAGRLLPNRVRGYESAPLARFRR